MIPSKCHTNDKLREKMVVSPFENQNHDDSDEYWQYFTANGSTTITNDANKAKKKWT